MHYAIDFESSYSDDVSVGTMGAYNYAHAADVFLVGIHGPDLEYVGPPADAPWDKIHGHHWVSHNASFDETVFYVLREKYIIPSCFFPSQWHCSADLSAYCGLGRKLSEAAWHGLGVKVSKALRQRIKNKRFCDLKPQFQEDFKKYCLEDARLSWHLWDKFSPEWPADEQEFALLIRRRCREGVGIEHSRLNVQKMLLTEMLAAAAAALPWGAPYLSPQKIRMHCVFLGIDPPKSLAEDSPEAEAWEAKYPDHPLVQNVREYRKCNIMLRKIEKMERRVMPNGRMHFSLKYHGAVATGRLSGTDGLNMQNLNREPYRGIDLRRLLVAAPGHKFLIADFAQIEPRVTAWLTGNKAFLARLGEGVSFYEEDAKSAGNWDGEAGTMKKSDPAKYQAQKAESLGISYGMGAERFCKAARDQLGLVIEPWRAKLIIERWHARNPGVRAAWNRIETGFRLSHERKEPFILTLPSGRSLRYIDISVRKGEFGTKFTARNSHAASWQYYWGGSLFENLVQATARDILKHAVLAAERAGIPVRFTAHDEIVAEVPVKFDKDKLRRVMVTGPEWALGLPLDVEITESPEYLK